MKAICQNSSSLLPTRGKKEKKFVLFFLGGQRLIWFGIWNAARQRYICLEDALHPGKLQVGKIFFLLDLMLSSIRSNPLAEGFHIVSRSLDLELFSRFFFASFLHLSNLNYAFLTIFGLNH